MKNFGKRALCLFVCLFVMGFLALPALAEHGWQEGPPQKGKPADPGVQAVGPTYYGQPMMLDEHGWQEGPPQKGKTEDPVNPTISPLAWWMQPALDWHPWVEDPPKGKEPQTP